MGGFELQIGAAADANELEYISALHQTDLDGVRTDGSIRRKNCPDPQVSHLVQSYSYKNLFVVLVLFGSKAEDISLFLLSRFGVVVTEEEVRETILDGLGGGVSGDECIDLMEVAGILLIPTILKAAKAEVEGTSLSDEYAKPDPILLQKTLTMILEDITGDGEPKPLNKEILRKIFTAYGEQELADDDALHEEMLKAAYQGESGGVKLDLRSFAAGLTYDLQDYDLRNEIRSSTHFDDVILTKDGKAMSSRTLHDQSSRQLTIEEFQSKQKKSTSVLRRGTAQAIDATAGTYRSKHLISVLWVTGIISYFAYWFDASLYTTNDRCPEYEYSRTSPWIINSDTIACETGFSVGIWLARFVLFSLWGLFYVGLGSLGNGIEGQHPLSSLLGLVVVFLFTFCPFYINRDEGENYLRWISLLLGLFVCVFHAGNFITLVLSSETRKKYPWLRVIVWSSSLRDLRELKQAAQKKLCSMASNALNVHKDYNGGVLATHFGRGLHNFALKGSMTQETGGFRWTWKRIFDRTIHSEYGLWYSNRLMSSNTAQFIISIYVLIFGIELTRNAMANFDSSEVKNTIADASEYFVDTAIDQVLLESLLSNFTGVLGDYVETSEAIDCSNISASNLELSSGLNATSEVDRSSEYLCSFAEATVNDSILDIQEQLDLLQKAGFDARAVEEAATFALSEAAVASVDSLYPTEEHMVFWPMVIGTVAAFLTAVYLAVIFLPSITSTILRLRSGMIPTLHDKHFNKYRFAGDQVSILTGSMFWGSLIASGLVGGTIGFIVFLFLWQAAVYFVQRAVAFIVAAVSVALFRICLLQGCRNTMYRAFYRTRPMPANISLLGLEWANFALSVAFILVRVVKLVITAGFYIGRIDTPFLAKGVGKIGNFELDNYPTVYLKDLLSHEAHRHPYIETLGTMYLMKLRYPDHFGQRAGSAWRLLFVYALMPWMHKYRIHIVEQPPLLVQGGSKDGHAGLFNMEKIGKMAQQMNVDNFGRMAQQMKQMLVAGRHDKEQEGTTHSQLAQEEFFQHALLAKEKSVKLEIENEALRNQIARLESQMDVGSKEGSATE